MGFDNVNVNVSGPVQPASTYKTKVLKGNHSFASQVTEPNMKYVIKYDFDLEDSEVTIPENCVLEFDGGSINNGKCIGNNTKLVGYDGTSTGLYGLYYDINGNLLEFSYKEPCDFKVNLNKIISNDVYGLLPYNYQSMVRYENYIFLIGHPVSDGTQHIRIQLFNAITFEYVGETDTSIYCHANGATVKDDSLMIAGSNGDINLYIIDCDDIISLCGSGIAVANATIDLTYLEEAIGYTGTYHTVQAIDYDAEKKEFAINISGNNIVITDNNLNYIRTGCTSVIDTVEEQYKLPVGLQDLAYKNGIVYINAMRTSKPSGGSYYNPSYHLICLIIDSISGTIVGYQEPDALFGNCEPQGLFKDADGYIWTNLLKWGDGATSSIRVCNICKLACHKLPQNDLYPLVNSDGKQNTLVDSNKSVPIYIDNSTTSVIQDGSNVYPYKTFNQAYFSTINSGKNITFYFKGSEEEYDVVMGTVIAKNIKLRNYSGTAKIALSADFINCSVDIQDIRVICRNKYNVTDSHISDDTFYACLKITNTSVIIRNSSIEYIDAFDQDDTRGNIGLIYSRSGNVVVERCSFSNIRYIICEAFGITGKFSNSSFSNVGHLLLVQKNTLAANIEITDCYTISTIDKLIKAAVSVLSATQSIFMYGSTVNNALNAIVVAHKTDVSRAVCYEQYGNTVANVETFDELAEYVKQPLIDTFGNDVQTIWSYKGYLGQGVYNYISGYFYNIITGQRLGTRNGGTTSERLDNTKQPFPNLSGSTYYDYTLQRTFVWQENHYQEIYANDNAYDIIGRLVSYVDNNITPGWLADGTDLNTLITPTTYLCATAASARSMINAPVSVETSYRLIITKTSGYFAAQIVIPNNRSGIYFRNISSVNGNVVTWTKWFRIACQIETYKQKGTTSERPAMNTSPTPNAGTDLYNLGYYYFDTTLNKPIWWNGNGWVDASGGGSLKILCIGDSVLRGYRNGNRAFFPYITTDYKQDAISGSRISGTSSSCFPQQLLDENNYTPDIIIVGTGVNDWNNNVALGTPPTTIITDDTAAAALNRTNVYDAVQYLFYQMIKKFPYAKKYFISHIKFDRDFVGSSGTNGNYVANNTQGYSYVDMMDGIKKICQRYGVVFIDMLEKSFVNAEFPIYKAPTRYDDVPAEDRDEWNATYYMDADGAHPTDRCYREVFAPIVKQFIY